MKKNVWIAVLAAAMVSAVSLAGCGSGEPVQPEASSAVVSSHTAPSSVESEASSSEAPSESGNDFEAVFAANALDADYEAQMETVSTTREIISVANTFAGLWNTEISNAYTQLLTTDGIDVKAIEADQRDWYNNLSDELEKIQQSVEGDGSTTQTERAILIKDFYREKAKALYEQLYQINPDYTYAYAPY